ncbi:MAG: hypothetical protein EP330_22350 [Deltaproteobacteria bacterium]|nr:MAG: hypothetical protein EP330_22350 [Deltaproteobacteria bacterium]
MQHALESLRHACPQVVAAAVVGLDGELHAVTADQDLDGVVGPTYTALDTVAQRAVQELGRGQLTFCLLEGAFGRIVVQDTGDGRALVVVSDEGARLGLLLDDVRAAAKAIAAAPEVAHA